MYQLQGTPGNQRTGLESPNYECMWLLLCPTLLPRPLFAWIAVCVVYNTPGWSAQEQREISNTIDTFNNRYPNCGLALMDDFNNLAHISRLTSNHRLKQVVSKPTRGGAILDLNITNIHKFYEVPVIMHRPFGIFGS